MLKFENLDIVLSLVNRKGNPSPAKLSIRITQDSTSAVAGDAPEPAQTLSETLDETSNTLMKRFKPLVEISGQIPKVRSSVSSPSLDDPNRSSPPKKDTCLCSLRVECAFFDFGGDLIQFLFFFHIRMIHSIRWCKHNEFRTRRF